MNTDTEPEIPSFLLRNTQGAAMADTQTQAPQPKRRKHRDAYVATVKISIPVDITNPSTIADAATAVGKLKDALPAGAIFDAEARMGKTEA